MFPAANTALAAAIIIAVLVEDVWFLTISFIFRPHRFDRIGCQATKKFLFVSLTRLDHLLS